jgi:hypothetical protein
MERSEIRGRRARVVRGFRGKPRRLVMDWISQNPELATALIAAGGALFGGLIAAIAKFLFDFYLSERIKRRWRTIDTKRRYSAQIIRAADDLAGRLGNINRHLRDGTATEWLRPIDEDREMPRVPFMRYYFSSTVYLLCRLIAWIEVLKHEQIFLDFASTKETRRFNAYLELILSILSYSSLTGSDSERALKNHWIYYHYLSGIGQSLFQKNEDELRCVTFQEFCERFRTNASGEFRGWISEVEGLVVNLSNKDDARWERLQMLWVCLDQFLDFADPKKMRTSRERTESRKLPAAIRAKVAEQARWYRLSVTI